MTATRPSAPVLGGGPVRLELMTDDHAPALWRAIGTPRVFAGGYGGGPAGLVGEADFAEWLGSYYGGANRLNYIVRLVGGIADGEVVGVTTLGDLDETAGSAHLGWTAYDARVWGTAVNPATKRLVLGLAFDHGYERVKLQADALNERSRAAILRLGAVFEGIARHERPRADGSWRDTAVYSILAAEWPAVRAALEARLEAWGDRPVAPRTL